MRKNELSFRSSRRAFLTNVLPAGALFQLGCGCLFSRERAGGQQNIGGQKHKFLEDSGMSFQEVFHFAFKDYIEFLQFLSGQIGKKKVLELLQKDSEEYAKTEAQENLKKYPNNDFATFIALSKEDPGRFWDHVWTRAVTEETDRSFAKKITECLYAKTFRDAGAADIGYAYTCYYDFPAAQAYSPKLRLIRTKTLMAGDDCCNPRYIWEG